MSRYSAILPVLAIISGAAGAAGQSQRQAAAGLSALIPAVTVLTRQTGPATIVSSGEYTEVRGAVILQVSANCSWRIVARRSGATAPLWLRAHAGSAAVSTSSAPRRLESGTTVAEGRNGRALAVVVDYRVPAGSSVGDVRFDVEQAPAPTLLASAVGR